MLINNNNIKYIEFDILLSDWFYRLALIADNWLDLRPAHWLEKKLYNVVGFYLDYLADLYNEISKTLILITMRCWHEY